MNKQSINGIKNMSAFSVDNLINPIQFLKQRTVCELCKMVLFNPVACKRCDGRFHS